MPETPNHGYNVPPAGEADWHVPLNKNFAQYDTDIEIRDTSGTRDQYEPTAGAKFLATDTGLVFLGDGNAWKPALATARYIAASSTWSGGAPNLVAGHTLNGVASDVSGAVVAGGGLKDGSDTFPNEVGDHYGTVSGGIGNTAAGSKSTISGGSENTASGEKAAVGGGGDNVAKGHESTIAGGANNEVTSANSTVGGGGANTATARYATASGGRANDAEAEFATVCGGENSIATGVGATVTGGKQNRASGTYSLAGGLEAEAFHAGTFVWADSQDQEFGSTDPNQFLVEAAGGVGLGTDSPVAQLHVSEAVSGTATTDNHVTVLENASSEGGEDVLALKLGETAPLEAGNNYVSFKDGNDDSVGSIEGDGSGGVTLQGPGSDYAEWLPRADPDESMEAGDVVGVHDGAVSLQTADADRAMVVTTQPIVTGNRPGATEADRDDHEQIAFVGQVPVRVWGLVEPGDVVVPTGDTDGTARAIPPTAYRPEDGPIVGQAWGSSESMGIEELTVAVGLEPGDVLGPALASQRERIDDLAAENEELRSRLAALEHTVDDLASADASDSRTAPADD